MTAPDSSFSTSVGTRSLPDRAKRILMQPKDEWHVIDGEPTTPAALYTGYIAPLSAIPAIAGFIGMSVFGLSLPFMGTYRVPITSGITSMIVRYVLGLVGVYVLALIIDALAPTFGGQKSQIQALKVAAYASTAAWLAGIFSLIPMLSILGLVGLYSLYLLYTGLPVLMKVAADRALTYTAAVMVSAIVIFLCIGLVAGRLIAYPRLTP